MRAAARMQQFEESIIREMTRHAMEHDAINLSQGFPDFDPPQAVVEAAVDAIRRGENQYTVTWGYPALRERLSEVYTPRLGREIDPNLHITVTCGVTEGIVAAVMAVVDPGDEVLIVEPAHENFRPAAIMAGGVPVPVPLSPPDYRLDPERLASVITPRARALLINTPHNPTGRVFDDEETAGLAELVVKHDLVLITDEIYEHILYDGRTHLSPARREGLAERTITVSGMSKTFAITGWRLGFVLAPTSLAVAVHKAHDYLTICAPTPLQAAGIAALNLPQPYFAAMAAAYAERREVMMGYLAEAGFQALMPEGAYYTIADYHSLPVEQAAWSSMDFALWLTKEVGVAVVPMTSFYSAPGYGQGSVRFAFPKRVDTLHSAGRRLLELGDLRR
ncbi:MAG: aminotransferase class I/II-fold pyridoxal phosphate-dependent enzyme [Caldilineaceae bacterium]|nr:aminotransferase class I/II-fold pyridoxal phosphate-dependent enzyme [Caldilineaceae bacterium]